ncbi:MAG: response regulator [Pseudomonadota bacterium]
MRRILLLDDEKNVLAALKRSIKQLYSSEEWEVETFSDAQAAIQRFAAVDFDFVVSDYHMPAMNGIDFLRIIKEIQPNTIRLMLSASADFRTVMDAINEAEVFRYISKPWVQEELKEIMDLASAHRDQIIEDKRLADQLRAQLNPISEQDKEAKLLEDEEPGITKVNWGPDGSVRLD